jgi:ribulose-phosphate 3-epimerase
MTPSPAASASAGTDAHVSASPRADAPASVLGRLLDGGRPLLSVGIMTADLLRLGEEMAALATTGVAIVHVDVMDGVYCPQITVGPPIVKALRTPLLKDVHLMVDDPLSKIDGFVAAGADMITFHLEGARQPHRVLQALGDAANVNDPGRGIVRGVGINPSTPVEALEPLLDELDYVLVLAINPGWSGQAFLAATERRLRRVRDMIAASGRPILLGVDGGVTQANIEHVARTGADIIVSGSAIFNGGDVAANVELMQQALRPSIARGSRAAEGITPRG